MTSVGFVNPWLLAGLPLAGLPVIIHLLTRARPRPIRYPTLRFLREAGSGMQALHRLKLIVLLALRCLVIAAFVVVFARPFLRAPGAEVLPGAKRRVVLLVDASMSMRAPAGLPSLVPSSHGWKTNTTVPGMRSFTFESILAAISPFVMWMSCPQACIAPSCSDFHGRPVSS